MMHRDGRGYPIPKARLSAIQWVNSTPHLSNSGATVHRDILDRTRGRDYLWFVQSMVAFLEPLLTEERGVQVLHSAAQVAADGGPGGVRLMFNELVARAGEPRDTRYMLDKLLTDKDEEFIDPLFADHYQDITDKLAQWVDSLDQSWPLNKYEKKLFAKYLGGASSRTGKQYMTQIRSYLASRKEFAEMPMPRMATYERILPDYYKGLALNPSEYNGDGQYPRDTLVGFLSRARKTTFGGAPYYANMSDFVSPDESDPTTYADWYNDLAIVYLLLQPSDKCRVIKEYVALERVQPGGAENVELDSEGHVTYDKHINKQRFVQAQSAVLSHANKFLVDGMIEHLRRVRPHFVADKFGEEAVTAALKTSLSNGVPRGKLQAESTLLINFAGTDFTNYDAHQEISVSNDVSYNALRLLFPAFLTPFVIDPYVVGTYRESRILVPGFGYIQTTGVKSGMVDTNLTDTLNCDFCDKYELARWAEDHPGVEPAVAFAMCADSCMANGDDRAKLTMLSADEINRYDWELGYIAQPTKQEITYAGDTLLHLYVTYLKTIVCTNPVDGHSIIRTDSVAKLIMSKLTPESSKPATPYSTVVDMFMSASRSVESPYLYLYVDFMYTYLPVFQQLVRGEITFEQLTSQMVVEQMNALVTQRGKVWLRRKGIDADYVIERMNTKYGYGDEGYRGDHGLESGAGAGLAALPQVRAIMALARSRYLEGTIGHSFA